VSLLIHALTITVVIALGGRVHADPPKEIANLFPSDTLAYAELFNTAELSPQLAALFKGSVLEDGLSFVHARKDAAKTMMELGNKRQLALIGLLTSSELLAEFKKLRIAAGVTGLTENGDVEAVLVILTSESPAAGLAARAYLSMSPQLRKVGEVSKIPVFQYRTPNIIYDPNGNQLIQHDKPFMDGPHEPTFAYMPGIFVIGTSKSAVSLPLRRFLGEEKGRGLGSAAAFQAAAAAYRQTGLFFILNYPEVISKLRSVGPLQAAKEGQGFTLRSLLAGGDSRFLEWFPFTATPKSVKSIAGCIRFRDGSIVATVAATFDPAQPSPLTTFLSGASVQLEILHHAPAPARWAFAVTLPEKNRGNAVVNFLDALMKSNGELGRLPHDIVNELEAKYRLSVADGLIGKVQDVTLIMPSKQELPKGGKPGPLIVLHTADNAAAEAWGDFFPKLIGHLGGNANPPQASIETINGIKVYTVPGAGLRWNAPLHCARNRTVVAIGLDRRLVASAVIPNAAGSVIGKDRGVSPAGGTEPTPIIGIVSLGHVIPSLFENPRPSGPVVPVEEPGRMPNGQPIPASVIEDMKKARKDLAMALESLPPAVMSVRRGNNELRLEIVQPKVQNGSLKTLIDATTNWLDRSSSYADANSNRRYEELDVIKG